jgi:hypothetical protein
VYVHLKHTLSELVLAALTDRRLRGVVRWLDTRCEALATGARVPAKRAPAWLLERRILDVSSGTVVLPAGARPHVAYVCRQAHRAAAVLRAASGVSGRGRLGSVRRGALLFNGGLFFECHEYFEGLWRRAAAPDRAFYQGIILVAAGFYHIEKGNRHGARTKLAAGIARLSPCPPEYLGVRLRRWLAALALWQARAQEGGTLGMLDVSEVPRIPLVVRSVR